MDASELLSSLQAEGFGLKVDGGILLVRPAALLTAELRQSIREHKAALMALLAPPPVRTDRGACFVCCRPLAAFPVPGEWLRCSECGRAGLYAPAQLAADPCAHYDALWRHGCALDDARLAARARGDEETATAIGAELDAMIVGPYAEARARVLGEVGK